MSLVYVEWVINYNKEKKDFGIFKMSINIVSNVISVVPCKFIPYILNIFF
jgi:hypothetical protein